MNFSESKKSSLISFFEPKEIKEWTDPYNLIPLKLLTIIVYLLELCAATIMLIFVVYETKGLFGHYRTVINQLLSFGYGAVSKKNSGYDSCLSASKFQNKALNDLIFSFEVFLFVFFAGSLIWNNCMWNHEYSDMVWTTT